MPTDAPLTVWVGSSGSATGFGVLMSLREQWGAALRMVALDTNPPHLNAAATIADAYRQVPPADGAEYEAELATAISNADTPVVYIPIYDSEILRAIRFAERRGRRPDFRVLAAGPSPAIVQCNDKLATFGRLRAANLPAADTRVLAELSLGGPARRTAIVKPRYGVASAVHVVCTPEEVQRRRDASDAERFIAQETCCAPEVTVDTFIGRDGGPNAGVVEVLCRERLQVKAGIATKSRIFRDDALASMAVRAGAALGLAGVFCLQTMRSPDDGGWRITDVNPRPGAGTRMCAAVGRDFTALNFADFLGDPIARFMAPVALPQFVVRQYAEYITTRGAA
jgi:carbamoylphosphate synthase large subunit